MNEILRAKIEACLLLSTSPNGFRFNVKMVTGLTKEGFHSTPECQAIYNKLSEGATQVSIYKLWCAEELL